MPNPPSFSRLLPPSAAPLTADELIASADLGADAPPERPYTVVNFVTSLDGRTALDGRSRALGDDGDLALFHALRENADAVLAGTTTMATENYGRVLSRPERRERRSAAGRPDEPLAVLISRSGAIPLQIPLFAQPEARVAVFTPGPVDGLQAAAAQVSHHIVAHGDLNAEAMRILRSEHGVRTLLCEGGPRLFGALLADGLVDELFLTIDPLLVGGGPSDGFLAGVPEAPRGARILWLLERSGSLFLRMAIR